MMSKPIHILHVSPSFFPAIAYGGPIYSTKAITDGIAQSESFTLEVLTTDTADPNTKERLQLQENPAKFEKGYSVRFCRSLAGTSVSAGFLLRLYRAVRRADVVHLTGPYNFPVIPTLIACRLFGTPLVWSPRGGFQATVQWSNAPKRKLKDAFEKLCAKLGPRRMVLHATSPAEAEIGTRNFPRAIPALIPNAVELPQKLPLRDWRTERRLRLGFLSRVHPKKGLDILIPALTALPDHVTLDIYGDGDPAYLTELTEQIARAGLSNRITFKGHVDDNEKNNAFASCDLFILPTHSENFGIVVAEALAQGTPVITTINAPWERLESEGCGRCVPATIDALTNAILELESCDLAAMGQRGHAWVARDFSIEGMVRKFDHLYKSVILVPAIKAASK